MNTLAFLGGGALLALVVMSLIPGVEHLVRPIIDLVFTLIKVIAESVWGWIVFVVKLVTKSHIEVFKNMTQSPESLDPTYEIKKKAENGE